MIKNKRRETVIYSKDIKESSLDQFKKQYDKIPANWLRRFKNDGWQLVFTTDISVVSNGNPMTMFVGDYSEKRVWINVNFATYGAFPVYRVFLFYLESEYGDFSESDYFKQQCKEEKGDISKSLGVSLDGFSAKDIFANIVIQMLEYPATSLKSLKSYLYVKELLNENIFRIRTSIIPDYMQIGSDITEYQIIQVKRAWEKVPIGLREKFNELQWNVLVTNSRSWRTDDSRKNIAGYFTTQSEQIIIRTSQPNIDMTLYHEFGHFMYYLNMNTFIVKDFYRAFSREKNDYFKATNDEYGISNVEEYFAQIFAHYIKSPEVVKSCASKSTAIVDSIAKRYK